MDIISMPLEEEDSSIGSRFRLTVVAAQRSRQIMEGSKLTIPCARDQIETSIAIEEIVSGKLEILTGEEAVIALEEEWQRREEAKRRAYLAEREEVASIKPKTDPNILLDALEKKEDTQETPST